jgi:general stress protein 26
MKNTKPVAELDERYSSAKATARPWSDAREQLENADLYWIVTVRPDGQPHVTPLIAVLVDDAMYFCTGPDERKAKNLAQNGRCVLMTGCNSITSGFDVVVEGEAVRVRDEVKLQRIADTYVTKYGPEWTFTVRDGAFHHEPGIALVFEVASSTAFGFGKGTPFSQTRYRF